MKILGISYLFDKSGAGVNERQLLIELCKGITCIILSPIDISNVRKLRHVLSSTYRDFQSGNVFIFPLVIPRLFIIEIIVLILLSPILFLLNIILKFDLIYIRGTLLAFGPLVFRSLASRAVVKIMALLEDEERRPMYRVLLRVVVPVIERFIISRSRFIATPTPLMFRELCLRRGLVPRIVILVPPGVKCGKIFALRKNKIGTDSFKVGFVGALFWWQGVDILVRAVAKLAGFGVKIKLVIVGDGPERNRILELCHKLKVDCVITGFVNHETALKIMTQLDVLVVPRIRMSTTENVLPIKIIEAWALGIPVIATHHKIFDSLGLRDGEDLLYCEPDPSDVADKIMILVNDVELRRKLVKNGYLRASEFCYEKISRRLLNVIES
jgi:glycosyltransferase involved in cell wall biosynthesis